MRIHKMTQEWLGAPDNLRMLHSFCHPEGMRARVACLGRNVATMKHHTGDSNREAESVRNKVRNRANDTFLILHRIVQLVIVANDVILRLHQIVRFASIVHR